MYPNDPHQFPTPTPTPPPTDYLNQIAPQAPKKTLMSFGIRQVIVVGGALILLVIILIIIVNSIAGARRDPLERLSARLTSTETIVTAAQPNLKSSKLRSLNSNLSLSMTNTNRDIAKPFLSAGIDIKKLDKKIVAGESTEALAERLENARLNAVYDRTYAREMAYQLGTLLTLMKQTYTDSNNGELRTFLTTAYNNLEPTQASFANFSENE